MRRKILQPSRGSNWGPLSNVNILVPIKAGLYSMAVQVCYISIPGPEVIKLLKLNLLSMKFILLINVKMPLIVGILTFISRINDLF